MSFTSVIFFESLIIGINFVSHAKVQVFSKKQIQTRANTKNYDLPQFSLRVLRTKNRKMSCDKRGFMGENKVAMCIFYTVLGTVDVEKFLVKNLTLHFYCCSFIKL
jgi:hypothetical protein